MLVNKKWVSLIVLVLFIISISSVVAVNNFVTYEHIFASGSCGNGNNNCEGDEIDVNYCLSLSNNDCYGDYCQHLTVEDYAGESTDEYWKEISGNLPEQIITNNGCYVSQAEEDGSHDDCGWFSVAPGTIFGTKTVIPKDDWDILHYGADKPYWNCNEDCLETGNFQMREQTGAVICNDNNKWYQCDESQAKKTLEAQSKYYSCISQTKYITLDNGLETQTLVTVYQWYKVDDNIPCLMNKEGQTLNEDSDSYKCTYHQPQGYTEAGYFWVKIEDGAVCTINHKSLTAQSQRYVCDGSKWNFCDTNKNVGQKIEDLICDGYSWGDNYDCENTDFWNLEECRGESCDDIGGELIWSYVLPVMEESKSLGLKPIDVGCCKTDECVQHNPMSNTAVCKDKNDISTPVGSLPPNQNNLICEVNNDWLACNLETEGQFNSDENIFCDGTEWIEIETDCYNKIDDKGYLGLEDCADPTCDGRLIGNTTSVCELEAEKNCNDFLDNDGDDQVPFTWEEAMEKKKEADALLSQISISNAGSDDKEGNMKYGEGENLAPAIVGINSITGNSIFVPEFWKGDMITGAASWNDNKKIWGEICEENEDCYSNMCNKNNLIYVCDGGEENDFCGEYYTDFLKCEPGLYCKEVVGQQDYEGLCSIATGTDCQDSDCLGSNGPYGAACCLSNNDCGTGAVCNLDINECQETNCMSNSASEDGDVFVNCQDPDCNGKICSNKPHGNCNQGKCVTWFAPGSAPSSKIVTVPLFSYKEMLQMLNGCNVVRGFGTGDYLCGTSSSCVFSQGGRISCSEEGATYATCCEASFKIGNKSEETIVDDVSGGSVDEPVGQNQPNTQEGVNLNENELLIKKIPLSLDELKSASLWYGSNLQLNANIACQEQFNKNCKEVKIMGQVKPELINCNTAFQIYVDSQEGLALGFPVIAVCQ
jgi:uncharacterized protein YbaR (Trm112 family)